MFSFGYYKQQPYQVAAIIFVFSFKLPGKNTGIQNIMHMNTLKKKIIKKKNLV